MASPEREMACVGEDGCAPGTRKGAPGCGVIFAALCGVGGLVLGYVIKALIEGRL